jgi:hypothetical protein
LYLAADTAVRLSERSRYKASSEDKSRNKEFNEFHRIMSDQAVSYTA